MYEILLTQISQPIGKHEYWKLIRDNAEAIVERTTKTSKGEVAIDLGMSSQRFSLVLPLIVAIYDR